MHITPARTDVILNTLMEQHHAEVCSDYGEPGYHSPAQGVVLANWNDISKRIGDYLEEAGFELEWSDEWVIDHNNDKAYRTSPDGYNWQSSVAYTDGGDLLTPDDDISEWVEEFQDTRRALPARIEPAELEELGFVRFGPEEPYESGFHPGQNDDPEAIIKQAHKAGAEHVVFRIPEVSQFYLRFECWVQYPEEEDE